MLEEKLEQYLKEKALAGYKETTLLSIRATIHSALPFITGNPLVLWRHFEEKQKPYARVTSWGRVCNFWDFVNPSENPYRVFRKKNKLLFKDQYKRHPADESLKSAEEKIRQIKNPEIEKKALELLYTGMRFSESLTYRDGKIVGKGDKERSVSLPDIEGPEFKVSYHTFLNHLKAVGLKPHTLRKIFLTECIDKGGANVFELQAIAGWTSLNSAMSYIGVRDHRLKEITKKVISGRKNK